MVWKKTGVTGGSSTQFGAQDMDKISSLFDGTADVDTVDINSNVSYRSGRLRKRGTGSPFYYIENTSAIVADRTITEPLLTANDQRTYDNHPTTLIGKSMSGSANTFTNIGDSAIAAHTSTKITITDRTHLPPLASYLDTAQTYTAVKRFDLPIKLKPVTVPTTDSSVGQLYPDSANSNALTYKKPDGTVTVLGSGTGGGGTSSSGPALYVPLFIYPNWYAGSTYNWTPLINAITLYPSVRFVVAINVANGPDTAVNTDYRDHGLLDLRNAANAAGTDLKIIGYVFTSYGARAAATVDTDVDRWLAFYPGQLDGIFFDEMENFPGEEAYYQACTNHVKSLGWAGISWGNPGAPSTTGYAATVDTIMVVETDNASRPNAATMLTRTFSGAFPNSKSAAIIYNQASLDTAYIDSTITPYVGYYYATNDTLSNPYDTLPTYLNSLCSKLATTSTGGASGAASFVTLATDGSLAAERVLTAGTGISITDAGANSTVTLSTKRKVLNRLVAEQDIVSSTTETDLLAYSVPAGTLGTDKAVKVVILADHLNNSGSARTFTLKIKYGATTMFSDASCSIPSGATRRPITIEFILFAKNSTTSQGVVAHIRTGHATTPATGLGNFGSTDTTDLATGTVIGVNAAENSAVAKTLSCTITNSFSASTVSFRRLYAVIEVLD